LGRLRPGRAADANFAAAYLGGAQADYDVINESQAKDGTLDAFQAMMSWQDLSDPAQYARLGQWLDVPAFIDYLLLNYYVGNQDVGELKNWYAIRRRAPGARFVYLVWTANKCCTTWRTTPSGARMKLRSGWRSI
jgi:spore coat protein CotH